MGLLAGTPLPKLKLENSRDPLLQQIVLNSGWNANRAKQSFHPIEPHHWPAGPTRLFKLDLGAPSTGRPWPIRARANFRTRLEPHPVPYGDSDEVLGRWASSKPGAS